MNKRFLDQLINSDFGWYVQDDFREGIALGIREIPTLFLNEKRVEGPLTLNRVTKQIKKELETLNKLAKDNSRLAA